MKLNKKYKIELAAADKSDYRYKLQEIEFDGERLIATNGHILAIVPVEKGETDTPGGISPDVIKTARSITKKTDTIELELNGVAKLSNGVIMPRQSKDGTYPNWKVISDNFVSSGHKIAFNVNLLKKLADAITQDGCVILDLPETNLEAIKVTSNNNKDNGTYGYIMQVRMNE